MRITWCVHPSKKHHDRGWIDRTGRPGEYTRPPFSYREGAGGIPPVRWWSRWARSRNIYYFDRIIAASARSNRSGGTLPRRPNRWKSNRWGKINSSYLLDIWPARKYAPVRSKWVFWATNRWEKVSKWSLSPEFSRSCIGAPHCVHPIAYPWRRLDPMDITYILASYVDSCALYSSELVWSYGCVNRSEIFATCVADRLQTDGMTSV